MHADRRPFLLARARITAAVRAWFAARDFVEAETAILQASPGAVEIGDRREAIQASIADLRRGDALLIAGKGHETGQIVGKQVLPFSDHEAVAAALGKGA